VRDGTGRRESLLQPFVTVGIRYEGFDDIKKGRKVWLIHVVQMSSVAFHCPLVAKDIGPVVTIFTTGTEGSDIMLWDVV